ncbi:YcxB family protein [Catenuloplanes indicus]|uniref:YcxB-like C-terminal domain-containing protein n=1 Tax=Catenuloplanes indicus TaxID=137267 RepID=A0AAE3VUV4_9ACTN|nr:YcxB family protein [Catenuloplanes indicus]MDQ0363682.1 hypothetical protein [Catenuloplanes indicus]
MQISLWVPYAALIPLGVLLIVLEPAMPLAYAALIIGFFLIFGAGPLTVARAVRAQSRAIRDGQHLTLDVEWMTVTYPLAESRFRWAGPDRVIDTPEVWYAMFGKAQAIAIPKAEMTDAQRAEFASLVATRLTPAVPPG